MTSSSDQASKIISRLFIGSLLCPLAYALLLTQDRSIYWLGVGGLTLYAVGAYWAIQSLGRGQKNIDWFLSLARINLLVLTPELILRQIDFHYEQGVQFGYPKLTRFESFVPDKDLFWRLPADRLGVNSWGFWGEEITRPKPAGVYRLLFLGDSVPRQGYPALVEALLNAQSRDKPVESVSLAASGYSSYQGRKLTDLYGRLLEPDLVIISYGWNDHWQAYGAIDSKKQIRVDQTARGRLFRAIYHHSRLLQGLGYILSPWFGEHGPLSLPADEYQDNLTYMGHFFTRRGVPVIFITPPTAHAHLGVPDYLVAEGFAASKAEVIARHRAYNQIVRQVAETEGWFLLDLAQELAATDNLANIFTEDGIHLTPTGLRVVAQHMADFIEANPSILTMSETQRLSKPLGSN